MQFADISRSCNAGKFCQRIIIDMQLSLLQAFLEYIFSLKNLCSLLFILEFAYLVSGLMSYDKLLPVRIRTLIFRGNDFYLISGNKLCMQRDDLSVHFRPYCPQTDLSMY